MSVVPVDLGLNKIGTAHPHIIFPPLLGKFGVSPLYSIAGGLLCQDPQMYGFQFNTIGVSDGMSMGTKGMMYSLPSRDS
jgi:hypothetical protein